MNASWYRAKIVQNENIQQKLFHTILSVQGSDIVFALVYFRLKTTAAIISVTLLMTQTG